MKKNRASQSRSNRRNPPKPKPWEIANQKKIERWIQTKEWAEQFSAGQLSDIIVSKLKSFQGRNISNTDLDAIEEVFLIKMEEIEKQPKPHNPEDDGC